MRILLVSLLVGSMLVSCTASPVSQNPVSPMDTEVKTPQEPQKQQEVTPNSPDIPAQDVLPASSTGDDITPTSMPESPEPVPPEATPDIGM